MTRTTIFLLLAATLLVVSGLAANHTGPQNPPRDVVPVMRATTEKGSPATITYRPMPEKYNVLLNRSIFARDGRASPQAPNAGSAGRRIPGQWVGPPGTEATLVFRGVTLSEGSYTAYIEDLTGGGVRRFGRGDDIAAGRIAGISLNGMDYESGHGVSRINLGQNLAGGDAPPPVAPATAPTMPPAPPEGTGHGQWHGRSNSPPTGAPPGSASGPEPTPPVAPQ